MNRAQQYIAILKTCDVITGAVLLHSIDRHNKITLRIVYLFFCLFVCLCSFTASCRKVSCRIRTAVNIFVRVLCDEFR